MKTVPDNLILNMNMNPYVVVIGGANMDIGGLSQKPLLKRDSNPGSVRMSMGGVGCNIAHNLALLEVPVTLLTAVGDDLYGKRIQADCEKVGIDLQKARIVQGAATSTYLYICDSDGELYAAVNDMSICDRITPEYIREHLLYINEAGAVVMDANLPEETIAYIGENVKSPLFADPVSAVKAPKLFPYMNRIHTLKPNRAEAEILSGIKMTNEADIKKAGCALVEKGVKEVFISLGKEGVFTAVAQTKHQDCAAHDGEKTASCDQTGCGLIDTRIFSRMDAVSVQNATGAGDAFMAALVYGFLQHNQLEQRVSFAQAAAVLAIESEETINPQLSVNHIRAKMAEMKENKRRNFHE